MREGSGRVGVRVQVRGRVGGRKIRVQGSGERKKKASGRQGSGTIFSIEGRMNGDWVYA
jgi:hypothetical protein